MKTLTNEEIITIVDNCTQTSIHFCDKYCPLAAECHHWYTGENCGSALEDEEED